MIVRWAVAVFFAASLPLSSSALADPAPGAVGADPMCVPGGQVTWFEIHGASIDQLMAMPTVADLSRSGGSSLLTGATGGLADDLRSQPGMPGYFVPNDAGTPPMDAEAQATFFQRADKFLGQAVARCGSDQMVIVVALPGVDVPAPEARTTLGGVVVGWNPGAKPPATLPGALTSSSTRRAGLVTADDLRSTIEAYLHPGAEATGAVTVVEGEPIAIYERYLAQRRMYVPIGMAAGIAAFLILASALSIFSRRTRVSRLTLRIGSWACLALPALAVAMLAAGHLPDLTYPEVALFLVAVTLALPAGALALGRRSVLGAPAILGLGILGLFAIEAATGWYGTMFTMLGGTALDGARFYGLSNAFEGLVLGSAVYVASVLTPWKGYAAILAVALFVGLPGLGADLGGAVVMLAAAGLWLALRTRGRPGIREVAIIAATVVVGIGVILLAHGLSSSPTHGSAFVEASGRDPMHVVSTFWDRLGIGVRLLRRNPLGLTYLAATPVLLWLVAKQRGGLRDSFAEFPHWRSAILTILWACVVAYFANDTGVSAVGMGFAMALGGLLYVPLAREAVKMDAR